MQKCVESGGRQTGAGSLTPTLSSRCPFPSWVFLDLVHAQSLSHAWLCYSMGCSPQGSSAHGILQARILGVGCQFPPPGDHPDPRIEPTSPVPPALASGFFYYYYYLFTCFNWRIITLQYCDFFFFFCHSSVWISHGNTCTLPSWIPLSLPSPPSPSRFSHSTGRWILYHCATWEAWISLMCNFIW